MLGANAKLFFRTRFHQEGAASLPPRSEIQGFSFSSPRTCHDRLEDLEGFDSWPHLSGPIWLVFKENNNNTCLNFLK